MTRARRSCAPSDVGGDAGRCSTWRTQAERIGCRLAGTVDAEDAVAIDVDEDERHRRRRRARAFVVLADLADIALDVGVEVSRMNETRGLYREQQHGNQPQERPAPTFAESGLGEHRRECRDNARTRQAR